MTKTTMEVINAMQNATREKFGDYGFACGYLGSLLEAALKELPEYKREQYLNTIEKTTANYL